MLRQGFSILQSCVRHLWRICRSIRKIRPNINKPSWLLLQLSRPSPAMHAFIPGSLSIRMGAPRLHGTDNMKFLNITLQVLGILLLVPAVAIGTLWLVTRNDDGPSIIFPGGELISGELYQGPEPDWSFTDQVRSVDLQLDETLNSRLIWINESGGKIYITSDYMGTWLGRLWKHWAVRAEAGDGLATVRINGIRYERKLVRITGGPELDGVIAKKRAKYRSTISREAIESGVTWVFELAPRE